MRSNLMALIVRILDAKSICAVVNTSDYMRLLATADDSRAIFDLTVVAVEKERPYRFDVYVS
jgi:hypothetical protein